MNPSMPSHYPSSFLSPTPDPASSAALQTPSPFIASTQVPSNLHPSRSTRCPGLQGPSFVQRSPSPTNAMPSISIQRGAQAQAPFHAVDLSLSLPTNDPAANYQSPTTPSPLSQHPPSLCNDSPSAYLKEKRPPRPSNAFILFRSDLLKRKFIFKGLETRQHKLSVIAAKCWDRLTREEKRKWFLEAEREKKAHAIKYGPRTQSSSRGALARARSRSRDESRIMALLPSTRDLEQERLGHLADMAYKEIVSDYDVPPQLKRESLISSSPTATLLSGSPTQPPRVQWSDIFTLDCYQEQGQLSPQALSPAGEQGHLSPTTSSASDFSIFQDAHMIPTTGFVGTPYPATIARYAYRPMCPTANSYSGTTTRQITTFPMLQGSDRSASINEQQLY